MLCCWLTCVLPFIIVHSFPSCSTRPCNQRGCLVFCHPCSCWRDAGSVLQCCSTFATCSCRAACGRGARLLLAACDFKMACCLLLLLLLGTRQGVRARWPLLLLL